MRHAITSTPLLDILRGLETNERREEFAAAAGTTVAYLYQLGGCHRGSCRSALANKIADASKSMNLLYGTPPVTMEQLATMCTLPGGA